MNVLKLTGTQEGEYRNEKRREERYLVLKLNDIQGALSPREKEILIKLEETINLYRKTIKAKPPVNCVVVEDGWPIYEQTWKMIEDWVNEEEAGKGE